MLLYPYMFIFTGPSLLTVNIIKNIENSSIVVQWDAVDDFLPTFYTVTWTDERDLYDVATVDEQTLYTITGLTLDIVYTISVTAANWCGDGPDFRTSISFFTNTTSTTPTVMASSNSMTIISTASPSSITAVTNSTTTIIAMINPSTTAMTTTFSRDIGTTIKSINIKTITITTNLSATATTTTVIEGFCIVTTMHY